MTDGVFDLNEFVDDAPVVKQIAPAEYNNDEFTFDPVAPVETVEVVGATGEAGKDGLEGKAGIDGQDGPQGADGLSGAHGSDGVSVVDTFVQDDELFMRLSDGKLINAGNVRGPQGFQGPQGSGGGKSYRGGGVKKDMFVQDTQPDTNDPFMWLQTNADANGNFSLWFNQC